MAIPQKPAFEGLRSGMVMINEEYHRLVKVAGIGIGAATLWQQRNAVVQFETLARNARWWENLKLLGVDFDEDAFRIDESVRRRMVPILWEKSAFDILFVLEFGHDYHIEGTIL
jgi:hypothetical protein